MPGYKGRVPTDDLGDRMKMYEAGTADRLMPFLPVLARLDGKSFHSFCRGLEKPFDPRFVLAMQDVTKWLVHKTGAVAGYVQSDEISLLWGIDEPNSQKVFFDRRVQKMVSILAALASVRFNQVIPQEILAEGNPENPPVFDCRVWVVQNQTEAANTFLWRVEDAKSNSVQAVGHKHFSHNQLYKVKNHEIVEKLRTEKNVDWEAFPPHLRFGMFYQRKEVSRPFTATELKKLPPKHKAHSDPNLQIVRQDIVEMPMQDFIFIKNRVGVLFNGEDFQVGV